MCRGRRRFVRAGLGWVLAMAASSPVQGRGLPGQGGDAAGEQPQRVRVAAAMVAGCRVGVRSSVQDFIGLRC